MQIGRVLQYVKIEFVQVKTLISLYTLREVNKSEMEKGKTLGVSI